MRIFGIEITRAPKKDKAIWVRAGVNPLGTLISEMSPAELRNELTWVAEELNKGNYLTVGAGDKFKRVLSFQPYPPLPTPQPTN